MPHIATLDGLRAIAVVAVLLFHANADWLPGGFLGVDVFFVLSGYLITSLLIEEWRRDGRIDLPAFWRRRARRLLPELAVVLATCLIYCVLFLPDEVLRLRSDVLAAAVYVMNWRLVFEHEPYFETFGRPSLLQHLWSLAVEEQFYLAWPPLFALSIRWLRPPGLLLAAIAGALASALLMALLYDPTQATSRLYYGTDTHASGVLMGAALAFVWAPWRSPQASGRFARFGFDAFAILALGAVTVAFFELDESRPLLYQGGFLMVAIATALLIAAAAHPSARVSTRALGNPVMRWLGTRSYGIYIWHWPLFMVTRPHTDIPLDGLDLAALRFALTFLLAETSYRFVRGPVRRSDLGAWWHAVRTAATARGWAIRAASLTGSAAAVVLVGVVASAHAPEPPAYLQVTEFHGIVGPASAGIPVAQTPTLLSPAGSATAPPAQDPAAPPAEDPGTAPAAPAPATNAPPPPPSKPLTPVYIEADVLAIGDSVMIGAAGELGRAGTVDIDAVVGRQASAITGVIDAHRAAGPLPPVVVIHTGDNGTFTRGQFDAIVADLPGARQIIFVNDKVDRPWEGSNNAMLASAVSAYPNVTLVDWHDASSGHSDYFWDDGLHLRPEGANAYARVIADAIHPPPPPPPPPPTPTPAPSPSPSPSASPSSSVSPSPSATSTVTVTPKVATVTPSASPTGTADAATPALSPSATSSPSPSPTP